MFNRMLLHAAVFAKELLYFYFAPKKNQESAF